MEGDGARPAQQHLDSGMFRGLRDACQVEREYSAY